MRHARSYQDGCIYDSMSHGMPTTLGRLQSAEFLQLFCCWILAEMKELTVVGNLWIMPFQIPRRI
jgi:hypothetical protein